MNRRQLLKTGVAALTLPALGFGGPFVAARRDEPLAFQGYPHPLMPEFDFAYAADADGDPFRTLPVSRGRIGVPDGMGERPFGVNARWFVEGFGHVWLEADNGGRYYSREDVAGGRLMNLNLEFARSRVARNVDALDRYRAAGTEFSAEVRHLHDLARDVLETAERRTDPEQAGDLANTALRYALWAAEKIELEHARAEIDRRQRQDTVYFGCETRQYVWVKSETFVERFVEAFNYATVTHYVWDSWYEVFEPREGVHRWGIKDNIVDWLLEHDITVEGRPLLWFHPWVTPDWLRDKSYDELKAYAERHVEALVGHYGDRVSHWEVVNEYHDWANIHRHTPEQITEITRLACEKTREVNPDIVRLINNCCPFGTYAAYGHDSAGEAPRPLRTPRQFVADLIAADVPFEVVGVQVYFPERDLQDIVRLVERFAAFGKPVHITEIGATSGPTRAEIISGQMEMPGPVYDWHRPWDTDLQADWLEQVYTIFYSKPYIEGINWYDFADFRTFIPNGGLVREDTTPKPSYERLRALLGRWDRLPTP